MDKNKVLGKQRRRRTFRVRNKLRGDAQRPRLSVHRSHANILCQIIDDESGKTLCAAGTMDKSLKGDIKYGGNCDAAQAVGKLIAQRALEAGIQMVRFDRGPYSYHGRVAALAEAAREAGLKF